LKSCRSLSQDPDIAFLNLRLLPVLYALFFLSHQPHMSWKVARQEQDKGASQQKLSARNIPIKKRDLSV